MKASTQMHFKISNGRRIIASDDGDNQHRQEYEDVHFCDKRTGSSQHMIVENYIA